MSKSTGAHIHDLLNRLSELQSRIILEAGVYSCTAKLEEAIEEVRALAQSLVAQNNTAEALRPTMHLREFIVGLRNCKKEVNIGVTSQINQEHDEVYGCVEDMRLITNELICNAMKAQATTLHISVADRGGEGTPTKFFFTIMVTGWKNLLSIT